MYRYTATLLLSATTLLIAAAGGCWREADPPAPAAATVPVPAPVNICLAAPAEPVPTPDADRKIPTISPVDQSLLVQYNGVQSNHKIAGQIAPCLCTHTVSTRFEVTREQGTHPPYTIWAGPLSGQGNRPGSFLLDRSDWSLTDKLGIASISLQEGWAMMVRPSGYPPLRTIRITTGRPRFHLENAPAPATNQAAAPTTRYAILGVIEPGATTDSGLEYFFMREAKPGEEEKLTLLSISEGTQTTTLSSGEYVAFDRKAGTFDKPAKLPTFEDLSKPPFKSYVKEAICAAFKASGERFFAGNAEKCN